VPKTDILIQPFR